MTDVVARATAALGGVGLPGMYDDYDQACQWAGLVRDLVAEIEALRADMAWHGITPSTLKET